MAPVTPQIITKVYDLLLYLIPQVSKFPRSQRYLAGERLGNISLDVLEMLLEAVYSREKTILLERANVKLETARYYVRLCKDLKLMNLHSYEIISKMINEVGVQLGGWLKQQRSRS
ncbi:MAG: diversity-generating retroelement protein Avd [Deltaproteobacteria bacterium]|nr:diversity-generating retroelement protein Avd [Deltaproteobacteria bacterium]MBI2501559.1 diversity-generating retroelement protein Avd [Deltaproteobacteria bacterium]